MRTIRYVIKTRTPADPLNLPWDIVVENTKGGKILVVQEPHPEAGSHLIGFEEEEQMCEWTVFEDDWQEKAIGHCPVFAVKGGMFSLRGLRVTEVIDQSEGN